MNHSARTLRRRLALILLLGAAGLLRAERGTAEIQGQGPAPSRMFHLAPGPGGDAWTLSFLGHQTQVPAHLTAAVSSIRSRAADQLDEIKKALP